MNKINPILILIIFSIISCGKVEKEEKCSTYENGVKVSSSCDSDISSAEEVIDNGIPNWCLGGLKQFANGQCAIGTEFVKKTPNYCGGMSEYSHPCSYTYWCCKPR